MHPRQLLSSALLLLVLVSSAATGQTVPVRLELLSEPTLRLELGEVREAPVRVRVLRESDGEPLPDVLVEFSVFGKILICAPLQPCNQPDPRLHGSYLYPWGVFSIRSDAQGIAVAPPLRAGTISGVYELYQAVYLTSGQNYTTLFTTTPRVLILQGNAAPFPPGSGISYSPGAVVSHIPVNGAWAQALLVITLVLSAAWLLRCR